MLQQRSFEDLGTPLAEVTFCVVDLETTGGSPANCAITEIGALKVRCGEVQGTFQTLVNPEREVPAFVRLLTGLSDEMLAEAPVIDTVLPNFLEFAKDSVLVAHNARFDVGFLNAALKRAAYDKLSLRVVDTAHLARKVLAGEVPNHKLATLAAYLRCAHAPCHRAYADVLATTDVLHHLIERAAGFGVTTLEDLLSLSSSRVDGTFSKIDLAAELPRTCGVYRFLGANGQTLYVGKATDIRQRVRSYFYGDPRRKVRDLLRETQRIEAEVHESMLEAEVAEARSIAHELPPYNRAGKRGATWYLKLDLRRGGRVAAARVPKAERALYLGPFASMRAVRTLIDGLRDATPIHRCREPASCVGCPSGQTGRCSAKSLPEHRRAISLVAGAVVREPTPIFDRLHARLRTLAAQERFEEAAEARERARSLEVAIHRNIEVWSLIDAGDVAFECDGRVFLVRRGRLAAARSAAGGDPAAIAREMRAHAPIAEPRAWLDLNDVREARIIIRWTERNADRIRLIHVDAPWVLPAGGRPQKRFVVRNLERDAAADGER